MEIEDSSQRAKRLSFVVAIMTKDYWRAIDMGISILNLDPNDHRVRECLSALRKIRKPDPSTAGQASDSSQRGTDLCSSGSEESDVAGSSNDDTDVRACDKDMESAVDAEKFCQTRNSTSAAECPRETLSYNTRGANKKFFNLREKMSRLLPPKFARKK